MSKTDHFRPNRSPSEERLKAAVLLKVQFLKVMCEVWGETASLNSLDFFLEAYTFLWEKKNPQNQK